MYLFSQHLFLLWLFLWCYHWFLAIRLYCPSLCLMCLYMCAHVSVHTCSGLFKFLCGFTVFIKYGYFSAFRMPLSDHLVWYLGINYPAYNFPFVLCPTLWSIPLETVVLYLLEIHAITLLSLVARDLFCSATQSWTHPPHTPFALASYTQVSLSSAHTAGLSLCSLLRP